MHHQFFKRKKRNIANPGCSYSMAVYSIEYIVAIGGGQRKAGARQVYAAPIFMNH